MNRDTLKKIETELNALRKSPHGHKAAEFESIARRLGRRLSNRGKEPNWERENDPKSATPISIPHHGKEIKVGTARNIIDSLLDDVDTWKQYLNEAQDEAD